MAKRDNTKAARALAEWSLTNFKYNAITKVAENHGVTTRTIENWFAALNKDSELSDLFSEHRNELTKGEWASNIDSTLSTILERIKFVSATSTDLPELTLAFEKVADVSLAKEIILHEYSLEQGTTVSEGFTQAQSTYSEAESLN